MSKFVLIQLTNTYVCTGGDAHEIPGALDCQAYMELDDTGESLIRYRDLDGNPLTLPEVQESRVINKKPALPGWAK